MSKQKSQPRCTTTVQFSPEFIDYLKEQSAHSGLSMGAYLESQITKLNSKVRLEQLASERASLESERAAEIEAIEIEARAAAEMAASKLLLVGKRYDTHISELSEKERAAQEEYDQSFEKLLFECSLDSCLSPAELVLSGIIWLAEPSGSVHSSYLELGKFIRSTLCDKKFSSREQAVQYLLGLDRHELTEAELQYLRKVDRVNSEIYKSLEQIDTAFGTEYRVAIEKSYAQSPKRDRQV